MNLMLHLEILKKFRSQADFAAACGICESAVSRTVRGRRQLSRDEASRWAELLNCEPDILPIRCEANGG